MRTYLSNFIETLSRRRQERVASLLEEARVGKEQLNVVAQRLSEQVGNFTPVVLRRDLPESLIRSDITTQNLRDLGLRVRDLYEASNLISLLLESHVAVLSSEIASLEKELLAMEKMATNFAFLLSDNQAFDYAFLEPFSDERIRATDLDLITDRSGVPFQALELASIRSDEGVLTMAPDSTEFQGLGLTVEQIKGNATAFKIAETNIGEVVKVNNKGWKTLIAAANPIAAPIENSGRSGAQIVLEFKLTSPSPASEIKIIPFSDLPMEVLKITLYESDDDSTSNEVLSVAQVIDRPYTHHFPLQSVSRFRLLVNQPVYERRFTEVNTVEDRYRDAIERINLLNMERNRASFSQKIANIERTIDTEANLFSRPTTDLRPDRGVMGPWNIRDTVLHNKWVEEGSPLINSSFFTTTDDKLASIDRNSGVLNNHVNHFSQLGDTSTPIGTVFTDYFKHVVRATQYQYFYSLGLQHVAIGVEKLGSGSFRSVYVSEVLPVQGEVGEIRLKTAEENVELNDLSRDSKVITSVEYSVTNVSVPRRESDWIPILPVGVGRVEGERLFVDEFGKGFTRFPVQAQSGIVVYRDGFRIDSSTYEFIRALDGSIVGVHLQGDGFLQHVYTCDYIPIGDQTTINFVERGFANKVRLASSFDESGAGERFLGTGSRNTVQLLHLPYVNLSLNSTPITVKLENGEMAVNLTNYSGDTEVNFPSTGYYYIHSGSSLMFNQPIRTPFRVFYQYLQNTTRFRVVLRCNDRNFAAPKVDYVHVKTKTRKTLV